jgi:6-phosphogluconolactonase/glucosamine-6-phosphate isomerase/deaminase
MNIHTSPQPDVDVAHALSSEFEKHKNTDILLLLAGGSALQVLDLLDTAYLNEYVTIMMMDERFTSDPKENNFLQMTKTAFHAITSAQGITMLPSVPKEEESHADFTKRIEDALTSYITYKPEATIIALFGIGPDGHTAGIFPMDKESFVDTYGQGQLYTQVNYEKNPSPERCSITPKFITNYITKSFVYATGESKLPILTTIQDPYELHEMPAHIHEHINSELFIDQAV